MNAKRLHRDEAGLVGKIVLVWLLLLALLAVAALDSVSIVVTRFKLSDAAATAATTAATDYRNQHDVNAACDAAAQSVVQDDAGAKMSKDWCRIDTTSGEATITLRQTATTVIAGRLSFTQDLAKVEQQESAGPGEL